MSNLKQAGAHVCVAVVVVGVLGHDLSANLQILSASGSFFGCLQSIIGSPHALC